MADMAIAPSEGFTRWQASGIHLLISVAIAAGALYLVRGVWYPPPLFTAEGGSDLLFILVAVDVVIGPLITLIIFKSGKPGLRFDLAVITLFRVAALVYGFHVMLQARPVFVALIDDQFETVRANDIDPADAARAPNPAYRSMPLAGPVFVAIEMPADAMELNELIAQALKGGTLAQHLPRYYVPYSGHREQAVARGRPAESLRGLEGYGDGPIEKQIAGTGYELSGLKFLLMQTRGGLGAVLIDAKTGDVVKLLAPRNP